MQGNWASSLSEREVSRFFSSCGGNLGYVLELWRGEPLKTFDVQRLQDSYLVTMDTSIIETTLGRTTRTLLQVRQGTEVNFLVGRVILGFLSIFKKSQALSPFEALIPCASQGVKGM